MADIVLTIDPDDTAFLLHDRANGRRLMGFDAPVPETDSQWAYSADTEGERRANLRYRNRVITASVLLEKSTAALLEALENTLGQKVGKLAREGGELRFTYPSGVAITFNVLEATMNRVFDIADMAKFRARYEVSFTCEPFGLGTEVDMGDNTETTLPCLIFTETGILGDVPGLGREVVDNDAAVDWWGVVWGQEQNRDYTFTDSTGSGGLYYEAESRTPLGSAATAVGPSGASGGGSNVVRLTSLASMYQSVLSTQASGGGAHLSLVGTFRFFARMQVPTTNTGTVMAALEWADGDFRSFTRNEGRTVSVGLWGKWVLVDLGLVTARKAVTGTQRFEARIVAKSTVTGDDIDIDYLLLVPVGAGYGVASGVESAETPATFSARSEFETESGAITGDSLAVGGTWTGAGDADDFTVAAGVATRTAVSDANFQTGRYVTASTPTLTATAVQCDVKQSSAGTGAIAVYLGIIARYTDVNNWLVAYLGTTNNSGGTSLAGALVIEKRVAGVVTYLGESVPALPFFNNEWWTIRLEVTPTGRVSGWANLQGATQGAPVFSTQDSDLATGGALDDGKVGLLDANISATASTRTYDNFFAFAPVSDAGVFAGQSLQIGSSNVIREDSAGAIWAHVSSYQGDYLRPLPAGQEARSTRTVTKALYEPELGTGVWPDGRIDDISARLFVTPRFLIVPDA